MSQETPRNAYDLHNISFKYFNANNSALTSVSCKIVKNKVTAILGPNGAGKSTFIDILLGWKKPTVLTINHDILLFDKPIQKYSRRELGQTVSLVPQNEPLQFSFTLLDYVLFGRAPHLMALGAPNIEDMDISYEAIKAVGLEKLINRSVTALSGGERQLLMIARSIAQQTNIMLLDEPTSSLDPGNTSKVQNLIKEISDAGKTVIFTTHDPNFAADLADNIIMLQNGNLLLSGSKDTVLTSTNLTGLYKTKIEVLYHNNRHIILRD